MNKEELHNIVETEESNICQIVGYKDNELVYQDNWHDYDSTDTCHVMSVTKSIISLLIGIAIDQGLIHSVDDKVLDYFPNYKTKRGEKTIGEVTIKHLLTMTAPYKYKSEPWTKVCTSDDWTIAALDLLGGRSGITGEFKYSTLGVHILSGIISTTSKMNTVDYANKYLFEPLGISEHINYLADTAEEHKEFVLSKSPKLDRWFCDPQGVGTAGYGLCLSATDLAKIGEVYLNNGIYEDKRIVSEGWIKESTTRQFKCDENFQNMAYGYLWWIVDEEKHIFAAIGDGGNVIYVNPVNNIVVGVTATFKPRIFYRVQFIQNNIEPYILNLKK